MRPPIFPYKIPIFNYSPEVTAPNPVLQTLIIGGASMGGLVLWIFNFCWQSYTLTQQHEAKIVQILEVVSCSACSGYRYRSYAIARSFIRYLPSICMLSPARMLLYALYRLIRYHLSVVGIRSCHPFAGSHRTEVVACCCSLIGKGRGYGRNEGDSKVGESLVGGWDVRRLGGSGSSLKFVFLFLAWESVGEESHS